jgi:recombination DNA repair RAD52 pathway protein
LENVRISIIGKGAKSKYIEKAESLFGPINAEPYQLMRNISNSTLSNFDQKMNPYIKDTISERIPISSANQFSDQALKSHFRLKATNLISSSNRGSQNEIKTSNNFLNSMLRRKMEQQKEEQIEKIDIPIIAKSRDFVL